MLELTDERACAGGRTDLPQMDLDMSVLSWWQMSKGNMSYCVNRTPGSCVICATRWFALHRCLNSTGRSLDQIESTRRIAVSTIPELGDEKCVFS